jgi:hypothetical protein
VKRKLATTKCTVAKEGAFSLVRFLKAGERY